MKITIIVEDGVNATPSSVVSAQPEPAASTAELSAGAAAPTVPASSEATAGINATVSASMSLQGLSAGAAPSET